MLIELINTGTELLLGRVLNTHQQWICRQLADHGYTVARQVAVPDTGSAIRQAVREALTRVDWVITTGGLGPTSDDLTRQLIAELLGRKLREDPAVLARIKDFFAQRQRPMPPSTAVQALVPDGAIVLPNSHGTAPGLLLKLQPNPFHPEARVSWLVMLPGPPRELRPLFSDQVLPLILRRSPLSTPFVCRTLRSVGLGESEVEERLASPLQAFTDAGLELGYCARSREVDIRLAARGSNAAERVREAEAVVRSLLGHHVFGQDDDNLETVVIRGLTDQRQTVAVAESCTGGRIADRLTNVPGASGVFRSGWVTYHDDSKRQLLGVRKETLATHGAVSEVVAREMAEGARRASGADFALAVTGIAGPSGGTETKPVGTGFIACASATGTTVLSVFNPWDRATFKEVTSQQALELLRRTALRSSAT
jgi:nicotinamide-nucleotide amidase